MMSDALPVTQPTVADHFFYPPVGPLERQWDLYVTVHQHHGRLEASGGGRRVG
jgi:hypothetical protein